MLKRIRTRWEITKSWQIFFPLLGSLLVLLTSYTITKKMLHLFNINNTAWEWPFSIIVTIIGYFLGVRFFLWCFKKLASKWVVNYKWEMIAIFIVFAITGSVSAKIAAPIIHSIGIDYNTTSPWLYWPVRIFAILPVYQILLVIFGWIFGQFRFFWNFEKRVLKRLGLGFLIP